MTAEVDKKKTLTIDSDISEDLLPEITSMIPAGPAALPEGTEEAESKKEDKTEMTKTPSGYVPLVEVKRILRRNSELEKTVETQNVVIDGHRKAAKYERDNTEAEMSAYLRRHSTIMGRAGPTTTVIERVGLIVVLVLVGIIFVLYSNDPQLAKSINSFFSKPVDTVAFFALVLGTVFVYFRYGRSKTPRK